MPAVRTALVGCGKVGQIHATALASLEEAQLVAVCDTSSERSQTFASRYGARPYTDVAMMLREARPEAVLIGTPHPLHAEPTLRAIEPGVHVLVEKPMAANLRDCDAMLAAARKAGTLLGVISQRRWYEPVQRIRAAIDAGKIGRPALALFLMYSWREPGYYQSDPWRGKWDSEGGGVLVNQSPHQLDLLRWFMGPIAEVSGYWANLNHPTVDVDDTAVAVLRFQNGGLGSIVTSVAQKPGIYTKVHVHGSNGASIGVETDRGATFIAGVSTIAEPPMNDLWTIPGEEPLLSQFQTEDRTRFQRLDATTHYHALQIQDFLRAIREGRPPLVTGEDGRASVELFTAIYLSNRDAGPSDFRCDPPIGVHPMNTMTRRTFGVQAGTLLAGTVVSGLRGAEPPDKRERLPVAAIVTEYRRNSHADVIVGKILEGFNQDGGAGPALRLAALYTDQVPNTDLSRDLAKKYDFRIARTIEEAITLGSDKVAVAGVLSIGEHGDYPYTKDTHQHMYPRRRFFDAIVEVFRKHKRVVPVFNDKHLAYAWDDAKHMAATARDMKIPFLAGSSLPVAWRTPALKLAQGCELMGALAVGYGGLESYGFHALETLQCMVERRRGGETGVATVQAVSGDAIAAALKERRWSRELLDAAADTTPLPRGGRPKELGKNAVFMLVEYVDGLKAAVAMSTGLANQFAFAGQIKGEARPSAAWFRLQDARPFGHFAHLLRAIEHTIHTGKAAYPVERTLLTTGILDAVMHSAAENNRVIKTPELAIRYQPVDWPFAAGVP